MCTCTTANTQSKCCMHVVLVWYCGGVTKQRVSLRLTLHTCGVRTCRTCNFWLVPGMCKTHACSFMKTLEATSSLILLEKKSIWWRYFNAMPFGMIRDSNRSHKKKNKNKYIEDGNGMPKLFKQSEVINVGHSMSNQHKKILTLTDLNKTWFLHSVCWDINPQ